MYNNIDIPEGTAKSRLSTVLFSPLCQCRHSKSILQNLEVSYFLSNNQTKSRQGINILLEAFYAQTTRKN